MKIFKARGNVVQKSRLGSCFKDCFMSTNERRDSAVWHPRYDQGMERFVLLEAQEWNYVDVMKKV